MEWKEKHITYNRISLGSLRTRQLQLHHTDGRLILATLNVLSDLETVSWSSAVNTGIIIFWIVGSQQSCIFEIRGP